MEMLMTSFGVSHLPPHRIQNPSAFYRMPPVSMSTFAKHFMPDYSALILCEKIIMDTESWDRLQKIEGNNYYQDIAKVFRILFDEGFIRVEDYDSIIKEKSHLLEIMLQHDLEVVESWYTPLKESLKTWREFTTRLSNEWQRLKLDMEQSPKQDFEDYYHHFVSCLHEVNNVASIKLAMFGQLQDALESESVLELSKFKQRISNILIEYLSYVNANLVLSHHFDAGFHDWCDFEPFYYKKFLSIGKEKRDEQEKINKVRQLSQIAFPDLIDWNPTRIVKALQDSRIKDFRKFIANAVKQNIDFNQEFANRTLSEVFGIERRISRIRSIVSYATIPLGFIPWIGAIAQKGTEEIISKLYENNVKKDYQWFYLISKLGNDVC